MLRVPKNLFLVLCIVPVTLSVGIALCVNIHSFLIMLSLAVVFFAVGLYKPAWFIPGFLFFLPLTGFIHNVLKTSPIPLLLPIPFIGLISQALLPTQKEKSAVELSMPTAVGALVIATIFSVGVALRPLIPFIPHWSAAVNSAPWGAVRLANALGWITLFTLITLSGVAFFQLVKNFSAVAETPRWIGAALAGCVLSGIFGLFQFMGWTTLGIVPVFVKVGAQYNGTFLDPNAAGIFSALLVSLWIFLVQRKAAKVFWLAGPFLLFLLIISDCRSGFLLLFVALALQMVLNLNKKGIRSIAVILCAFLILIGMGFLRQRIHANDTRVVNVATNILESVRSGNLTPLLGDRHQLWKAGWITFKLNPWFGTGIGTYLIRMPSYQRLIGQITNDTCGNTYLHILAEQGVLGFAVFLWLIGSVILRFIHQLSRRPVPALEVSAFSAFAGLLTACIFGTHLLCFEVNILFWLLLAMMLAEPRSGVNA